MIFSNEKGAKTGWTAVAGKQNENGVSRERRSSFSLELWEIGPSTDFGARRENDLRGTGYAWTPVLVSFFKLFKVGFLPTWVLFPFLVLFDVSVGLRP